MNATGPRWQALYDKLDEIEDRAWANNLDGKWLEVAVRVAHTRARLWTKDRRY